MKHSNWLRVSCFCVACLVLVLGAGMAAAEKNWVNPGVGEVDADLHGIHSFTTNPGETISEFDPNYERVFNVGRSGASYCFSIDAPDDACWFVLNVNNTVAQKQSGKQGGLYLWLMAPHEEPVLANAAVPASRSAYAVRLDGNVKYKLCFVAYNNTEGAVSFSLDARKDLYGEREADAVEIPAGIRNVETIAVPVDQDWFHIPASSADGTMTICVENLSSGKATVEVRDAFGDSVKSGTAAPGDTVRLSFQKKGESFYTVSMKMQGAGHMDQYVYSWCDGVRHVLNGGSQCILCEKTISH